MAEIKRRMRQGRKRPIAGREEILKAAYDLGVRRGWKAVTTRAIATRLKYTSPILYQHFSNKRDILTTLAKQGQLRLAEELVRDLPEDAQIAVDLVVQRYWSFVMEQSPFYRLMNAMDGVEIDRDALNEFAQKSFEATKKVIAGRLAAGKPGPEFLTALTNELWAVLHGMAVLHLDRAAFFDLPHAQECVERILLGAALQLAAPH